MLQRRRRDAALLYRQLKEKPESLCEARCATLAFRLTAATRGGEELMTMKNPVHPEACPAPVHRAFKKWSIFQGRNPLQTL